eukprot:5527332-Alexandrium_andersonii.AAC.1
MMRGRSGCPEVVACSTPGQISKYGFRLAARVARSRPPYDCEHGSGRENVGMLRKTAVRNIRSVSGSFGRV